jgi:Mrp family chromosome partitioning ATPase
MQPNQTLASQPSVIGSIWRYRWLVGISAIGVGLLALVYSANSPANNVAVVTLVLEDLNTSNVLAQPTSGSLDRFVDNQVEIMRSSTVALEAVELLAADGVQVPVQAVLTGTTISTLRETDVVTILFRYSEPAIAQQVADALVLAYQQVRFEQEQRNVDAILDRLDTADRLLELELADVQSQLAAAPVGQQTRADFEAALAQVTSEIFGAVRQLETGANSNTVELLAELRERQSTIEASLELAAERPGTVALVAEQQSILDRRARIKTRRNEVQIDAQTTSSGIAFLSPASVSEVSSGAGRLLTVLGGAVLGGLAGTGVAYFLTTRRRLFVDSMEPQEILGAPLLAEVPDFSTEEGQTSLPVRDDPRSLIAESFRFAASNLGVRADSSSSNTVAVVSAVVGEGKSLVLANLAAALAKSGRRVIVIDADFGNQSVTKILRGNLDTGPGLTELVELGASPDRVVTPVSIGGGGEVLLLSRGQRPVLAPEFFSSQATQNALRQLGARDSLVLIDTPPVLQVAYASLLLRMTDGAVVVIPHGAQLRRTQELAGRLQFLQVPTLGYVYNRAPQSRDLPLSEGSMKDVLGDQGWTDQPIRTGRRR